MHYAYIIAISSVVLALAIGVFITIVVLRRYVRSIEFLHARDMSSRVSKSKFFSRLQPHDLIARHVITQDDYSDLYIASIVEFTRGEKIKIINAVRSLDSVLEGFPKLRDIPWKFAKLSVGMEANYPHTIEDVIILNEIVLLSAPEALMETLLHEKVHIYQRLFEYETKKMIVNVLGLIPYAQYNSISLIAANPDIDDIVYKNGDYIYFVAYATPTPKSTRDTYLYRSKINNEGMPENRDNIFYSTAGFEPEILQVDHPYEIMAEYISNILTNNISNIDIENWMKNNL